MAENNQGFAAVVSAIERLRDTAYNNTGLRISVSRARLMEEKKQTDEIKKLANDNRQLKGKQGQSVKEQNSFFRNLMSGRGITGKGYTQEEAKAAALKIQKQQPQGLLSKRMTEDEAKAAALRVQKQQPKGLLSDDVFKEFRQLLRQLIIFVNGETPKVKKSRQSNKADAVEYSGRDKYAVVLGRKLEKSRQKAGQNSIKNRGLSIPDQKSQIQSSRIEIEDQLGAFRRAIADGQNQLAIQLGERILLDAENIKQAYRDIEKAFDNPQDQKSIQSQIGYITQLQNEVVKGKPNAPGKANKGIIQIADQEFQAAQLGDQTAKGFVGGINGQIDQLILSGEILGKSALKGAKKSLGIASPSREAELLAEYFVDGWVVGLRSIGTSTDKALTEQSDRLRKRLKVQGQKRNSEGRYKEGNPEQPRDKQGRYIAESVQEQIAEIALEIKNLAIRGENVTLIANKVNLASGENAKSTELRLAKAIATEIRSKPLLVQSGFMDKLSAGFAFAFSQQISKGFGRGTKKNTGIDTEDIGYGVGNFITNPMGATAEGIGFRRRSRVQNSADLAREMAAKENVDIDNNRENIFTVGGMGAKGKGGVYVAKEVESAFGKQKVKAIPFKTKNTDPLSDALKDPIEFAVDMYWNYINNLFLQGANPDAIKLAAKVIAAKKKNKNAKIQLVGHSQGGLVVEEAIAILSEAGISDVQGTGLGTPNAGIGYETKGQYRSVFGRTDEIATSGMAKAFPRQGKNQDVDNIPGVADLTGHKIGDYLNHPESLDRIAPDQKWAVIEKALDSQIDGIIREAKVSAKLGKSGAMSPESLQKIGDRLLGEIRAGKQLIEESGQKSLAPFLDEYRQLSEQLGAVFPGLKADFEKLLQTFQPPSNDPGNVEAESSPEFDISPLQTAIADLRMEFDGLAAAIAGIRVLIERTTPPEPPTEPTPATEETPPEMPQTTAGKYGNYLQGIIAEARQTAEESIRALIPNFKSLGIQQKRDAAAGYNKGLQAQVKEYRKAVKAGDLALASELGEKLLADAQTVGKVYDDILAAVPDDYVGTKSLQTQRGQVTRIQNEVLSGDKGTGRSPVGLPDLVANVEEMAGAGDNAAQSLIDSLESRIKDAKQSGVDIGENLADGTDKALGINSPSKVYKAIGKNIIAGLEQGLTGFEGTLEEKRQLLKTYVKSVIELVYDFKKVMGEAETPAQEVRKLFQEIGKAGTATPEQLDRAKGYFPQLAISPEVPANDAGYRQEGNQMLLGKAYAKGQPNGMTIGDVSGVFAHEYTHALQSNFDKNQNEVDSRALTAKGKKLSDDPAVANGAKASAKRFLTQVSRFRFKLRKQLWDLIYRQETEAYANQFSVNEQIEDRGFFKADAANQVPFYKRLNAKIKPTGDTQEMEAIAENATDSLTQSVDSELGNVKEAGADIGQSLLEGTENALQIESPSKVYKAIGKNIIAGLMQGMDGFEGTLEEKEKILETYVKSVIELIYSFKKVTGKPMGEADAVRKLFQEIGQEGAATPAQLAKAQKYFPQVERLPDASPGVALYNPKQNKIKIKQGRDLDKLSADLMHEYTHAIQARFGVGMRFATTPADFFPKTAMSPKGEKHLGDRRVDQASDASANYLMGAFNITPEQGRRYETQFNHVKRSESEAYANELGVGTEQQRRGFFKADADEIAVQIKAAREETKKAAAELKQAAEQQAKTVKEAGAKVGKAFADGVEEGKQTIGDRLNGFLDWLEGIPVVGQLVKWGRQLAGAIAGLFGKKEQPKPQAQKPKPVTVERTEEKTAKAKVKFKNRPEPVEIELDTANIAEQIQAVADPWVDETEIAPITAQPTAIEIAPIEVAQEIEETIGNAIDPQRQADRWLAYISQWAKNLGKTFDDSIGAEITELKASGKNIAQELRVKIDKVGNGLEQRQKQFRQAIAEGNAQVAKAVGTELVEQSEKLRVLYKRMAENVKFAEGRGAWRDQAAEMTKVQKEAVKGYPNLKGRAKTGAWQAIATNTADGFTQGMEKELSDAEQSGYDLGEAAIAGAKKALGIKSPSTEFLDIARNVVEGWNNGLSALGDDAANNVRRFMRSISDGTDQAIQDIDQGIGQIFTTIGNAFPILKTFKGAILAIGAGFLIDAALGAIVDNFSQFALGAFDSVVAAESLTRSFVSLTGSSAKAQKSMAYAAQTAQKLGVDLKTAEDAYKGMIATTRGSALEGLQTDQIFYAFSDTAAARGLNNEEQQRMFAAIQQMLSKNKLSAEEVRGQLGEISALDFQGTLARSMGVSVAQLDEAMSSGSLMASDVLPKVAAQYAAENAIVANSSETTAQAMTRYSNALELLRRSMGEWFSEAKYLFSAAATGIELITKVMPALIQWVSALGLALAWNSVSLFAALVKIPIVSKIVAIALRELGKAIGFILSGPGLKMLATYAAQIILIQFAFDAVSAAVNTTQNRFAEYANAIEKTRKAVEAMEAAQAKLNKTQSQAGKNLPTKSGDVVTNQTWKPFGIDTGINLEPVRQTLGLTTLGEKQMNDFKVMASNDSQQVNKVLNEGYQVTGEVEKITEIDRQLAIVRSRRFENIRGDKQAYEQSVKAEKELLAKREEVLAYTSSYQQSLDSSITSVEQRLADIEAMKARGGITQDEANYQTTMAEAELSDLKKARTEFEKLTNALTQSVNGLEREMRNLNEQTTAFNESLDRSATNNRVAFLRQAAASGTGSTIRDMGLNALSSNDNQARVGFLRDRLSTQELLLSDPEFAAIAEELRQQAAALGTDLENTATLDRIIAENRDGTTNQVAQLIKEILDTKTQLGQAEEQIAQSLIDQRSALTDLNRTIADFFQQLTQQFEEARIELDRVKNQLRYGGLKQKIRQALIPGSNSFLNGVIGSIEGLFDQAASVLDGALGRRSGRLAWAGEKYSMENQMQDFSRSVNGATEALLGFRQALGGGKPARGSSGGQNFVQPARQGQTGAVRYTAPSRPNPTPQSVRTDFTPPTVSQPDRPLPVPPPTSNQFVTPAPQSNAPFQPPTVTPAPQSSQPLDLLQQAMENNANGRSLTAPIEAIPVVQPPPTPQPQRQFVEQIQSRASNLLRLPSGYESANQLTAMIQSMPFFNPNNPQGIAAMVINAAIAATELLGKNTRIPVNQFATKKGGAGGIYTGYGQYNPRYHPQALGSVDSMATYTGQIITGQRKLPNSKGQTNFAAQLVQEVRAGMIRNGQDLIAFLNRGGAASLAGTKGGSNWEGLINGWGRNPGLADALVDYLNQQIGQVQSSLNFGVNPGEVELGKTSQLGKWVEGVIDGAGNFLESVTNRNPKTLLELARKFARDNQQFLDGVDVVTASQQLTVGKFKVKSLQSGFNNLAKSKGFTVPTPTQSNQPVRQTQTGGQQSAPVNNPANTKLPMAQRLNLAKEYVNFYNKVHKLNLSAKQLGMASKALAEFRSSDKKLQSQFENYVNLSEKERQQVRSSLQAAKTKTDADMNLGWKTEQKTTPQTNPLPQPPKRDHPLGTVLNGKLWAGPTWGWQSKASYQKIMAGQSIQLAQSPAMGSIPQPPNMGALPAPPPLGVPSLPNSRYDDPIIQQGQGLQGQYVGIREETLDVQDQIGQQDLGNFLLEADRVEQEYLRGQSDNLRQLDNTLFESNNSMADLLTQYGPQTLTSQAEADARQANAALRNTYNQLFEQRRAQEDELRTAIRLVESNKQNIAELKSAPASSPEEAAMNQRSIQLLENQNIVLQRDVIPSYQQALKETASQELMMQKAIATMDEWLAVQQKQRELAQQGEMIALGAAIAQATYNEQLKLTNELQAADNEFETSALEESRKLADNPELLEQTIQGLATIRDRRKQSAQFEYQSVLRNRQIELLGREIALNQAKFNGEKVYSLSLLQAELEGQSKKAEIMEKVANLQERQNQLAMTDLETAEQKRQIEFNRINMMLGFKQSDRDLESRSAENRANLSRNMFWATDTREQNAVANRQLEFERRAEEIRQTQPADRQDSMIAREAEILAQDLELIDREFRDLSETIGDNLGSAFTSFYEALINGDNALKAFGNALFKSIGDIGSQMMQQGMSGILQGLFGKGGWIGGMFGAGAEFSSGGYTGDGGKYDPAGIVHAGEFVINKEATRKIGLPALMTANTFGTLPGYATGGYVGIESRLLSGLNSARMPSISLPTQKNPATAIAGPVSNTVNVNINDRESRFYKQAPTIAREMANKLRG